MYLLYLTGESIYLGLKWSRKHPNWRFNPLITRYSPILVNHPAHPDEIDGIAVPFLIEKVQGNTPYINPASQSIRADTELTKKIFHSWQKLSDLHMEMK